MKSSTDKHRIVPFGGNPAFGEGSSALIFDHLHKCAGTTFRHQLSSQFEVFFDASFLEAWAKHEQSLRKCSAAQLAIAGHTALGMHELLPPHYKSYYITVLREPYSRALSEYRFLRAWYYPVPSIQDYLRQMQPNYLVNRIGNGDLNLALDRLDSFYHLFGLTERFDDFLTHLGVLTNRDFSSYENLNLSTATAEGPAESIRAEFTSRNALDLQLYAAAEDLFDSRFRALGTTSQRTQAESRIKSGEHVKPSTEIIELIERKGFLQAARKVDALTPKNEAERLQLLFSSSQLHLLSGNTSEAADKAIAATKISAETTILQKIDPAEAHSVLHNALSRYESIYSQLPDSHLNRFRTAAGNQLKELERHAWQKDDATLLHCRWIIMQLANLVQSISARPVRAAVYGNGKHTEWLLTLLKQLHLPIVVTMILDDNAKSSQKTAGKNSIPIRRPESSLASSFDVIILSSDTAEAVMRQRCGATFEKTVRVCSLYEGFPFPPGPFAKTNPSLPRVSLLCINPHMRQNSRTIMQSQHYPNLEFLTTCTPDSIVNSPGPAPWFVEVPAPQTLKCLDTIRLLLEKATGEWICLIDQESDMAPDALHALADCAENRNAIIGATLLKHNGVCTDVISQRSTCPEALLEWWHHDVIQPFSNAVFYRRTALIKALDLIGNVRTLGAELIYELLLILATHPEALAITGEILASTESSVPVLDPATASEIAARHVQRLDPSARKRHDQLTLMLRGTTDDFVRLQQTSPSPANIDLPPISVITPSFNSHEFLARACYSVTMQQYPHVEHIIVDGNSSDGTQELFTRFPVRAISEPDKGMYDAVNKGIRMASHEFILVLSSDDFLEPGALHAIGTFLSRHPETQYLTGGLRVITPDRKVSYNSASSDRFSNLIRWWRKDAYPYNTAAYVFTRKHWEQTGGFDENLKAAADADFVLKSRRRTPFVSIPDIFATWDMRSDCITMQTRTGLGLDEITAVTSRHIDALPPAERKQFLAEQERTISSVV